MATVKQTLQAALEAFGPNGENWTQGEDVFNEPKCCIGTSFARLPKYPKEALLDKCWKALRDASHRTNDISLITWNDEAGRTWPEVKALFEKAIEVSA